MYREPVCGELLGCVQGKGVDIILSGTKINVKR